MICFELLNDYSHICIHGFSEKSDGNFSFQPPRDPGSARSSWEKASVKLGFDIKQVVRPGQVHGDRILSARPEHALVPVGESGILEGYDGTMTAQPGICLTGVFADCVPVFLLDPVNKVISLVHSGWKGTVARIVVKAVRQMKRQYGSKTRDLVGVIGPCICREHYPVSGETAGLLRAVCGNQQDRFLKPAGQDAWHADLAGIVSWCMMDAGISETNIAISGLCTLCDQGRFFSHRGEGADTGRMAAFLALVS